MSSITIHDVEELAATLEAESETQREKLLRLIRAYCRILAVRGDRFCGRRCATWHGDESGHWDNSYPPEQVYGERTGPRLVKIVGYVSEDVPTSTGFYHDWRRVTVDQGLYVDRDGDLWGGDETGTGRLGAFAAHPGDCGVDCTIEWDTLAVRDVPTDRLELAERKLRELAFPRATAGAAEVQS